MTPPTSNSQKDSPKKSTKEMSKAERRELQEKQRAEKENKKNAGPPNSNSKGSKKPQEASKNVAPAQGKGKAAKPESSGINVQAEKKNVSKKSMGLFSHLEGGSSKEGSVSEKEVHPAVVEIALQMKSYAISGSNARCIAMLHAFKKVISDYSTPPDTPLCRHLITHLSPMIKYLKECFWPPIGFGYGKRNSVSKERDFNS
ncbi:hypothetical protein DSO57_1015069 [Entomophthora muscae]|uniref:Uncharacterized protein n=1 Tax=Entomophthora muscae TaxID=34485 RepID=A0ACC2SIC7_9FUNG|nr:hypothetical protein DSO57_1015069 [Entomophthora muscae]